MVSSRLDAALADLELRITQSSKERDDIVNSRLDAADERDAVAKNRLQAAAAELELRIAQSAEERDAVVQALEMAVGELAKGFGQRLDGQQSSTAKHIAGLREELEATLEGLRAAVKDADVEFHESIEREMRSESGALAKMEKRVAADIGSLRKQAQEETAAQLQRLAEAEKRTELVLRKAADASDGAIRRHEEEARSVVEALGNELRGVVAESERRLELHETQVSARFGGLERACTGLERRMADAPAPGGMERTGDRPEHRCSVADAPAPHASTTSHEGAISSHRMQDAVDILERATREAKSAAETAVTRAAACETTVKETVAKLCHGSLLAKAEDLAEVRVVAESLAAGLLQLARCCGFQPAFPRWHLGPAAGPRATVQELLECERREGPLEARIGRPSDDGETGLARAEEVKVLEAAVRDLDERVSCLRAEVAGMPPGGWRRSGPAFSPAPDAKEPMVGAFGAHARSRSAGRPSRLAPGSGCPSEAPASRSGRASPAAAGRPPSEASEAASLEEPQVGAAGGLPPQPPAEGPRVRRPSPRSRPLAFSFDPSRPHFDYLQCGGSASLQTVAAVEVQG